jgi:Tfp pilus assembly protein PilE
MKDIRRIMVKDRYIQFTFMELMIVAVAVICLLLAAIIK